MRDEAIAGFGASRAGSSVLRTSFGGLVGSVLLARFEQEVTRAEEYERHDEQRGEDDKERQTKVPRHGQPEKNQRGECAEIRPNYTTNPRPEKDRGQKPFRYGKAGMPL